ncbi:MAG: hypothetical protein IKK06_02425 [Clostridia bacterium]|nr:hypothetical protein [Clostridia bacterium]
MKHYFERSRRRNTFSYRRAPENPLDILYGMIALIAALTAYPAAETPHGLIYWGLGIGLLTMLYFFYFNRVKAKVYIEDGVLYRKGVFFGFRTQLTTEYIKGVIYKKTLLGDSILILSNDCAGKPSTWSKSVVVVLDTPNNRDLLHYLKDRDKEEFLI